jgi:hypothetical protein
LAILLAFLVVGPRALALLHLLIKNLHDARNKEIGEKSKHGDAIATGCAIVAPEALQCVIPRPVFFLVGSLGILQNLWGSAERHAMKEVSKNFCKLESFFPELCVLQHAMQPGTRSTELLNQNVLGAIARERLGESRLCHVCYFEMIRRGLHQ